MKLTLGHFADLSFKVKVHLWEHVTHGHVIQRHSSVSLNELQPPTSLAAVGLLFSVNYHSAVECCGSLWSLSVREYQLIHTGCMGTQIH